MPIECVARGYLSGSGWKDYQATGAVCGIQLPGGPARVGSPCRSPSSRRPPRRASGHDINISEAEAATLVDPAVLARARELTLAAVLGRRGTHAEACGIIVADTKFEFGLLPDDGRPAVDRLILIDEVLTPDSSRFWPKDTLRARRRAAELRQAVRPRLPRSDQVEQAAAGPALADDVVVKTREKYIEAYRRLTGRELA